MMKAVGKKLSRLSLSAQIAEHLREEISIGIYAPGTLLPSEVALSREYGVSRPVVREAFKLLDAQGFVQGSNGKRTTVREINDELLQVFFRRLLGKGSSSYVVDLFQVRSELENMSAVLAARSRTARDLTMLRKTLDGMLEATNDNAEYSLLDVKFHIQLAQVSHNAFLYHLITSIRETLISVASGLRFELQISQLPDIQEHHESIYRALEHGNPDEARKAMTRHSESVMKRLPLNIKKRTRSN